MLKKYVFEVAGKLVEVEADKEDEARALVRLKAMADGLGNREPYLLTTCPVESKIYRCKRCKDVYDSEELIELRQMGEHYNKEPFLCPDCWDEFQRLDSEDQVKYLVEGRYDW